MLAAGGLLLAGFVAWERRREERGEEPLLHLDLLKIPPLRGGVSMLLAQNLVLMGIFFTIPLYLQIVQGLDALETGIRMLPDLGRPLRQRPRRLRRWPRASRRSCWSASASPSSSSPPCC